MTAISLRLAIAIGVMAGASTFAAQERKPVPKDSVRVSVAGCARGARFTAGTPSEDQPGGTAIPEGTRLRMLGPKKLMAEIKGAEGARIEITGLVRRGQALQEGIGIGGGVRVTPGPAPRGGGASIGFMGGNGGVLVDVEGWRRIGGDCPTR